MTRKTFFRDAQRTSEEADSLWDDTNRPNPINWYASLLIQVGKTTAIKPAIGWNKSRALF